MTKVLNPRERKAKAPRPNEVEVFRRISSISAECIRDRRPEEILMLLQEYGIPAAISVDSLPELYKMAFHQAQNKVLSYTLPKKIYDAVSKLTIKNFICSKMELDNLAFINQGRYYKVIGVEVGSKKVSHGFGAHFSWPILTPKNVQETAKKIVKDEIHQILFRNLGIPTFTAYQEDMDCFSRNLQLFLENPQREING